MVLTVDERDVDRQPGKPLRRRKTAETGANDDDSWAKVSDIAQ